MYHFSFVSYVICLQVDHYSRRVCHKLTKPQHLGLVPFIHNMECCYPVNQGKVSIPRAKLIAMDQCIQSNRDELLVGKYADHELEACTGGYVPHIPVSHLEGSCVCTCAQVSQSHGGTSCIGPHSYMNLLDSAHHRLEWAPLRDITVCTSTIQSIQHLKYYEFIHNLF